MNTKDNKETINIKWTQTLFHRKLDLKNKKKTGPLQKQCCLNWAIYLCWQSKLSRFHSTAQELPNVMHDAVCALFFFSFSSDIYLVHPKLQSMLLDGSLGPQQNFYLWIKYY